MTKLVDGFPLLANALLKFLREGGQEALAEQVECATIDRVSFDSEANAGYVWVVPSRNLEVVETNIIGVRHGKTVPVETPFWTNIDTDNFDRLTGIEILNPGDLRAELRRRADG